MKPVWRTQTGFKKEGGKAVLNVVLRTELGSKERRVFPLCLGPAHGGKHRGQLGARLDKAGGASRRHSHHRPPLT